MAARLWVFLCSRSETPQDPRILASRPPNRTAGVPRSRGRSRSIDSRNVKLLLDKPVARSRYSTHFRSLCPLFSLSPRSGSPGRARLVVVRHGTRKSRVREEE